ncbi:hypothetical protein AGR7C_Cc240013 [Agrobacterium deltaense Zutra 3/1]|uniref:Uncharacterized protein n=1 Tax=Agrobacterium deltaense Zutra 3/1 TaxID=1183427 RepID=A0A1S7Q2J9_9HYPH|nr:hypothetical protein AGR7C_Cc240013 [Agrobacterium deltaense Zutra 3/1]
MSKVRKRRAGRPCTSPARKSCGRICGLMGWKRKLAAGQNGDVDARLRLVDPVFMCVADADDQDVIVRSHGINNQMRPEPMDTQRR